MRDATLAALPLGIALLGSGVLPNPGSDQTTRVRLAPTAVVRSLEDLAVTDEELGWLDEHNPFGIPRATFPGDRSLVIRQGYTLAHNNVDLIADWVSFHLTSEYMRGEEKRPGSSAFKPDPLLRAGRRAELADYKGWKGVYDRGHQCASGDSKGRGTTVIRESFFLSNMTPQCSRLNQHRWRLLEQRIQELARSGPELWVLTGPVYLDDDGDGLVEYSVIGGNQVAVPTHYFKVVIRERRDGELESMSFLVPNQVVDDHFEHFLVSIDNIERVAGFDFLSGLEDSQEEAVEREIAREVWAP